jgi:hypothetical protein
MSTYGRLFVPSKHDLLRRWLIALMMEAARTSETLVNFYQTVRRYNQKTAIFVLTAVRTSDPTMYGLLPLRMAPVTSEFSRFIVWVGCLDDYVITDSSTWLLGLGDTGNFPKVISACRNSCWCSRKLSLLLSDLTKTGMWWLVFVQLSVRFHENPLCGLSSCIR